MSNFENSAKPRVGDWVIAVGNPFGLGGTATAGIISAYGRDIGETFVDYIQIDAPINRGNSGGPTFDIYGRVIGVNTAIFSPSGGSVGIGFAIPADVADAVTKQLISGGKITARLYRRDDPELHARDGRGPGPRRRRRAPSSPTWCAGGPSARARPDARRRGRRGERRSGEDLLGADPRGGQGRAGDALQPRRDPRAASARTVEMRSGIRPSEKELASNDNTPAGAATGAAAPRRRPGAGRCWACRSCPLDEAARRG